MANNPNATQASPGLNIPTPGQPINNIGITTQGGMFPPGANSNGATSTLAETSAGRLPLNVLIQNEGQPAQTLAVALSSGTDGGTQSSPANGIPFGSGLSGGTAGIGGAGGA